MENSWSTTSSFPLVLLPLAIFILELLLNSLKYLGPPYGAYNDAAVQVLANRRYQTVIWSEDDGDSTGASVQQSLASYEAMYGTYPAPHNVLNHETYANTANYIVPVVVPKLLAAGWKLVTLATW